MAIPRPRLHLRYVCPTPDPCLVVEGQRHHHTLFRGVPKTKSSILLTIRIHQIRWRVAYWITHNIGCFYNGHPKASNELASSSQQLVASSQQLVASSQQLVASVVAQQLVASSQRIVAQLQLQLITSQLYQGPTVLLASQLLLTSRYQIKQLVATTRS